MRWHFLPLVAVFLGSVGCGKKAKEESPKYMEHAAKRKDDSELTKRRNIVQEPLGSPSPDQNVALVQGKALQPDPKKDGVQRKIRYTADLSIIVTDLGKSTSQLRQIIKDNKSEVAKSEETGSAGTIRQGTWRIRVPVEFFEPFRDAVLKLGDVDKNVTDSEDMTEEYYDVEKDIESKLKEEQRLQKFLDKMADKMNVEKMGENYAALNKQLNDILADLNRKKGRLKLITNLTDLTTVTVALREKQKYDPDKAPDSKETPTFGQRAGRTFEDSVEGLANFGKGLVLILVALAPWLPFVGIVAVPGWVLMRRQGRQRRLVEEKSEAARLAKRKRAEGVEAVEVVEDSGAAPPSDAPKLPEPPAQA